MRQAGRIATATMNAAIGAILPGLRQCDVASALYAAQLAGADGAGGGVPNTVVMAAGERTRAPHLKWNDSRYEPGTPINIELSGCRHQYHAAIARTIYVGSPPQGLRNLVGVVQDAMDVALDTFRAGIPVEDVVRAWTKVVSSAGYSKSLRMGYAIGMCFQPTWIERTISLQMGDTSITEPNMTFHVLSGMWEGPDRLIMSETIRVTDTGYEQLTHCPRILHVRE